jgi:hypothetical protein
MVNFFLTTFKKNVGCLPYCTVTLYNRTLDDDIAVSADSRKEKRRQMSPIAFRLYVKSMGSQIFSRN